MEQKELVTFENTYIEDTNELNTTYIGKDAPEMNALGCVTIDGFPAEEDEEGSVVCRIWLTTCRDIIVDWHDNGYRNNNTVHELIKDSIRLLLKRYHEEETPFSFYVYPMIEFENDAVICQYHGQHNRPPKPWMVTAIVDAVRSSYEAAGIKVKSARPVSEAAYKLFLTRDKQGGSHSTGGTPLDNTTVSWHNEDIIIDKNVLIGNPPDLNTCVCIGIRQAWEQDGFQKNNQASALLDMYTMAPDAELFEQQLKDFTGQDFTECLKEILEHESDGFKTAVRKRVKTLRSQGKKGDSDGQNSG